MTLPLTPPVFSRWVKGIFLSILSPAHWKLHTGVTDTRWQAGKPEATSRDAPRRYADDSNNRHTPSDSVRGSDALWWGGLRWFLSLIMVLLPKNGSPEKRENASPLFEKEQGAAFMVSVGLIHSFTSGTSATPTTDKHTGERCTCVLECRKNACFWHSLGNDLDFLEPGIFRL